MAKKNDSPPQAVALWTMIGCWLIGDYCLLLARPSISSERKWLESLSDFTVKGRIKEGKYLNERMTIKWIRTTYFMAYLRGK
eukprot:CCRYP_009067-RA/>CCRYP_009067-RA protein AED:0.48 eAED:0.48 QI:0/-1/0/1/-1/1/1/0/81